MSSEQPLLTHQSKLINLEYRILYATQTPGGIKTQIQVFKEGRLIFTDSPNLTSAKTRTQFANILTSKIAVKKEMVDQDLIDIAHICQKKILEENSFSKEEQKIVITQEEEKIALDFLSQPKLINLISEDIEKIGVIGEKPNALLIYLIATSRLLSDPLSTIVKGSSSAGKSQLVKRIMSLMPKEVIKDYAHLSAKALSYMEEGSLRHKVLVVYERPGAEAGDYQIRILQSEQNFKIATTIKDPKTGKFRVQEKEIAGPLAYIETTTETTIHPENETRNFSIFVDESSEQTQRIQESQKSKYQLIGSNKIEKDVIIKKHHTVQRLLLSHKVLIPFIKHISFPINNIRSRRDFPRFLALIECITIIHQKQRQINCFDGGEVLIATIDDYCIAYDLAHKIFIEYNALIPPKSRQLLDMARSFNGQSFTLAMFIEKTSWTRIETKKYLDPLVDSGFLEEVSGRQGQRYEYRLIRIDELEENLGLITPEDLANKIIQDEKSFQYEGREQKVNF